MSTPRPAATVLLIRAEPESTEEDFSLFFVRRNAQSAFMANAYVFPGGKVEPSDSEPDLLSRSTPLAARDLEEMQLPYEVAMGYAVAAVRETFEEAGVLLATQSSGVPVCGDTEELQSRLESLRAQLNEGTISFSEVVAAEKWNLALDSMVYWDHWITPEQEERRFSARFFLAEMPPGFRPVHDSMETTDSGWFTPSAILERYEQDRLTLAPPTLRVLIELQEFGSLARVRQIMRERNVPQPNLPVAHRDGGAFYLLLPGDKDYPNSSSTDLHRAKMVNGRWVLIR